MQEIFDQKSKQYEIQANTDVNSPITEFYMNNLDFVADNLMTDIEGTGVNGFSITLNKKGGSNYYRQDTKFTCPEENLTETLKSHFKAGDVLTYFKKEKDGNYSLSFEKKAPKENLTSQSLVA